MMFIIVLKRDSILLYNYSNKLNKLSNKIKQFNDDIDTSSYIKQENVLNQLIIYNV